MNPPKITVRKLFDNLKLLIGILIFVTIFSKLFGASNTLMGVAINIGMIMFPDIDLGLETKTASTIILLLFPLIGLATMLSLWNPILGIVVNFISIYLLLVPTTLPLAYKTYMPFILCYIFSQGNPVYGHDFYLRIAGLAVGGALNAIIYYHAHKDKTHTKTLKDLRQIALHPTIRNRFILRLAAGLTIAMFVGSLLGLKKTMWISIAVMSLTQPLFEDSLKRIVHRLLATLVGIALFTILFDYLIPPSYSTLFLLLMSYIYTFIKEYKIQQVFVTINSLSGAMLLFNTPVAASMRFGLLLLAIVIVTFIGHISVVLTGPMPMNNDFNSTPTV